MFLFLFVDTTNLVLVYKIVSIDTDYFNPLDHFFNNVLKYLIPNECDNTIVLYYYCVVSNIHSFSRKDYIFVLITVFYLNECSFLTLFVCRFSDTNLYLIYYGDGIDEVDILIVTLLDPDYDEIFVDYNGITLYWISLMVSNI